MKRTRDDTPKGLKPLQIKYFALFGKEAPKPIPPKLVRIFGYPLSAIISQLLFWKGMEMRKDGLIFKTEKDFINELGLSSAQQKLAIKKGKELGFLTVVRKSIPAKRHYAINFDALVDATIREADKASASSRDNTFGYQETTVSFTLIRAVANKPLPEILELRTSNFCSVSGI